MNDALGVKRRLGRGATALAILLLAACATAPVQEMSDARQAIQAAEEAGAVQSAPQALSDARRLLDSAERKLQQKAYSSARHDAREARRRAAEALRASKARQD
ncbi:MAG: DUF4398 domain-containing protein [Gammaproteobacteria bacterium]|jgi:hypothetical protein